MSRKNSSPTHYQRPAAQEGSYLVRCLGPGDEHTFYTDDPSKRRICPRCRSRIQEMRLSMRDEPLPDPSRNFDG